MHDNHVFSKMQAEVQAVHQDGTVLLHTRSLRYGLLQNGQILIVSSCLVKRQRQHMATFEDYGVAIVLGCNGLIWVGMESSDDSKPRDQTFTSIAIISQAIRALSQLKMMISIESISHVAGLSVRDGIEPSRMGQQDFLKAILVSL